MHNCVFHTIGDRMKDNNSTHIGKELNGVKILSFFTKEQGKHRRSYFECLCECGNIFIDRCEIIKKCFNRSCGCKTHSLLGKQRKLPGNMAVINKIQRTYVYNAKRRNLDFSLSREEFENFIFDSCKYCGNQPTLTKWRVSGKFNKKEEIYSNGIDRIDSLIGYTKENCVTCCYQCNLAKLDFSLKEFKIWARRFINYNTNNENSILNENLSG